MHSPQDARGIAESLVERGLAAGASAADALYAGDRSAEVQVRLGKLESASRSESEEIGLRLFVGQQSATAASSDLSDDALASLVERCLAMARQAPEDPYAGLAPPELLQRGALPDLDSEDGAEPPSDPASRLNNKFEFFETMQARGREAAQQFLAAHFDDIGSRSTMDAAVEADEEYARE